MDNTPGLTPQEIIDLFGTQSDGRRFTWPAAKSSIIGRLQFADGRIKINSAIKRDFELRLYMDIAAADGMVRFGTQGESQEEYHDFHNRILQNIGEFRWVRSTRAQERRSSRAT